MNGVSVLQKRQKDTKKELHEEKGILRGDTNKDTLISNYYYDIV